MSFSVGLGWVTRAAVLLLSFINTRLLIDRIGADGLAAFSIIISLLPWLALMNLGLPITVQNTISRLRGQGTDFQLVRDQAFGLMLLVTVVMAPLAVMVGWLTHYFLLVNYSFASAGAVIYASLFIYIAGQSQMLAQIMYAEHQTIWPNIYPLFAALWTMAVLVIACYWNVDNFNLLLFFVTVSNLAAPIHAAVKLKVFQRAKFDYQSAWHQIYSSKDQFLFVTLALLTLSVDYLIMSRVLHALEIVNYNLVSRLFMTLLVIHGVLLAANWTPVADLMHAGEKIQAREKLEHVLKQGLVIGGGVGLIIFVGMNSAVQLLTGGAVDEIPSGLSIAFWIYILLRIWTDTYAMALQGYGMVSSINRFIPFQALISLSGQYFLGVHLGAVGIVIGMILSFLLTASWIIPRKFYSVTES